MSSKLLDVRTNLNGDDGLSEGSSSDFFDEEAARMLDGSGGDPAAGERLQDTVKRWAALFLWLATLIPLGLSLFMRLPDYFDINMATWARFSLLSIIVQTAVRIVLVGLIRRKRRADNERLASGNSTGGVDLASYLEAILGPLTVLLTTCVVAGAWYSVFPFDCPAEPVVATGSETAQQSVSIPIVDEDSAAASILLNSVNTGISGGGSPFSRVLIQMFTKICIFQLMTDLFLCLVIVSTILIIERVVMRVGHLRFLRSNFQDRILEGRYRTYVVEHIRNRSGTGFPGSAERKELPPIAFPFLLPFAIPGVDELVRWLNRGLEAHEQTFDGLVSGRPLTYAEYKHSLLGWMACHGMEEVTEHVAAALPKTDGDSKQLAKDLFARLCSQDRDYLVIGDFLGLFQGRASSRDAYAIFDRDQDGTVSKTEFRHTCITVYREMRNLARSVRDAGEAFGKLTDSVHLLVVLGLAFVCMGIFGVQVQSIFAIILSLVLGLNVLVGDVAKRSFQGIVFLFVDHPYDVGDKVLVSALSEKDPLLIHRINMLTTVFHRWNGQEVYVPNANLASSTIYNISRSAEQWERIDLTLRLPAEDRDKLGLLRDKLEAFLKGKAADYAGPYELKPVIAGEVGRAEGSLETIAMSLRVQCRPTLDAQKRWNRHIRLLSFLKATIAAAGLQLHGAQSVD